MTLARPCLPGLTAAATLVLGILLAAPPASAAGINLSWDDCGTFGLAQKNFACNTNSGTDQLFCSVVPSIAMTSLNGVECVVTITTPAATLPAWWQKQTGGCHAGAPATTTVFTGSVNCIDPWGANGFASANYDYPVTGYGPDMGRIRTIATRLSGTFAINNSSEYYVTKIGINHTKSTGTGACAGCTTSACIILQSIKLSGPGTSAPTQTLSNPVTRQHVIWQDAAPLVGCPGATPTRNRTWGEIKTLYR